MTPEAFLPELGDTAAQPTDIAYGKILYDDDGDPVTGNIVDVDDYHNDAAWNNIFLSKPYTSYNDKDELYLLYTDCTLKNDTIFRKNVVIPICSTNGYQLGEARPEDVRAGVTFTSGKAELKKWAKWKLVAALADSIVGRNIRLRVLIKIRLKTLALQPQAIQDPRIIAIQLRMTAIINQHQEVSHSTHTIFQQVQLMVRQNIYIINNGAINLVHITNGL